MPFRARDRNPEGRREEQCGQRRAHVGSSVYRRCEVPDAMSVHVAPPSAEYSVRQL